MHQFCPCKIKFPVQYKLMMCHEFHMNVRIDNLTLRSSHSGSLRYYSQHSGMKREVSTSNNVHPTRWHVSTQGF